MCSIRDFVPSAERAYASNSSSSSSYLDIFAGISSLASKTGAILHAFRLLARLWGTKRKRSRSPPIRVRRTESTSHRLTICLSRCSFALLSKNISVKRPIPRSPTFQHRSPHAQTCAHCHAVVTRHFGPGSILAPGGFRSLRHYNQARHDCPVGSWPQRAFRLPRRPKGHLEI